MYKHKLIPMTVRFPRTIYMALKAKAKILNQPFYKVVISCMRRSNEILSVRN